MNVLVRMTMVALIFGVSLAAGTAHAGLLAYDGFDYTGTTLNGMDGGIGFSDAWNDTGSTVGLASDEESLAPSAIPFPAVGSRVTSSPGASGRYAFRYVSDAFDFDQEGQMYMSFLMQKNSISATGGETLDIIGYDSFAGGSGQTFRIIIGSGDQFGVALSVDSFAWRTGDTIAKDTAYFGVAKIVSHSGTTADEIYLKIYSPGDNVDTTEPTVWDAETTCAVTGRKFERVRFAYGANTDGDIDEFRYGSDWASVAVPEPGTLSLMLALLCGAAVYLRKRA